MSFAPDLLAGHHIVVTGGGSGLGRSMAERFGSLGARVTVCGRRPEPLEETVAAIRDAGGEAFGVSCNMRESDAIDDAFGQAEAEQGPITRLVNNAAANFLAPSHQISDNGFDAIVKTNLYGSFYATRWCGQKWIERAGADGKANGGVVSIATTYAEMGSAFVLPSAVSKAGIVAMTKSLAAEWGVYNIRLNAIAPGPFPTEGAWKRLVPDESMQEDWKKRVPLRRFGEHEELANCAAFLLSDLSSYLTGTMVTLDGGEVLNTGGQFNHFTSLPREGMLAAFEMMKPSK